MISNRIGYYSRTNLLNINLVIEYGKYLNKISNFRISEYKKTMKEINEIKNLKDSVSEVEYLKKLQILREKLLK